MITLQNENDSKIIKKAQTFQENQKLTLNDVEQNKTKDKVKKENNKQQKKVTFKGIENVKGKFVDIIEVNSYKKDNKIMIDFGEAKKEDDETVVDLAAQASIFIEEIKNKNDNLNVFEGLSINKQELINNKPQIGFWEEIFCCGRADNKRKVNAVIDRIVNRHPNNNNIVLNTDEINAINRDIQTYMRD